MGSDATFFGNAFFCVDVSMKNQIARRLMSGYDGSKGAGDVILVFCCAGDAIREREVYDELKKTVAVATVVLIDHMYDGPTGPEARQFVGANVMMLGSFLDALVYLQHLPASARVLCAGINLQNGGAVKEDHVSTIARRLHVAEADLVRAMRNPTVGAFIESVYFPACRDAARLRSQHMYMFFHFVLFHLRVVLVVCMNATVRSVAYEDCAHIPFDDPGAYFESLEALFREVIGERYKKCGK